jgi:hypothetical protein
VAEAGNRLLDSLALLREQLLCAGRIHAGRVSREIGQ